MYTFILGGLPGIPGHTVVPGLDIDSRGRYEDRALQTGDVIEARATDLHPERTSRSKLYVPDMLDRAHFTRPARRYKLPQRTVSQELYATQIPHELCITCMGIQLDYNADEDVIGVKRTPFRRTARTARIDNGCTRVSLNLSSDAFVILASDSASMGEYVCGRRRRLLNSEWHFIVVKPPE